MRLDSRTLTSNIAFLLLDSRTPINNITFLPSVSQAAEIAMLLVGCFLKCEAKRCFTFLYEYDIIVKNYLKC